MTTTNTNQTFQPGEVVKVTTYHGYGRGTSVDTYNVDHVTRSGLVVLMPKYSGGRGLKFNADGTPYSKGTYDTPYSKGTYGKLSKLADGETSESIAAANKAKANAAKTAQDAKDAEHAAKVAVWWHETGEAWWAARTTLLGAFFGKDIHVVKYDDRGELRMPFVVIGERSDWCGGKTVKLTVGGLTGRQYENDEGTQTSISTYSSSSVTGKTLEEALYNLTH